jgi:DNA-binding IclR family transcriptional regulator
LPELTGTAGWRGAMPERLEIGAVLPFHATALGNPVLAYLEDGVRADLLSETSPKLTGRRSRARQS